MTKDKIKAQWSEARRKAFIVGALRNGTRRYPPKYECLNEAKTEKKINPKTGRLAQHYQCNMCKKEYTATQVEVDHIKPAVPPETGWTNWDAFINGLYCGKDNLQTLCKACHKLKTKEERKKK